MPISPSYQWETRLRQQGYRAIAGVDEVGRGPLAGPLVAGAVILPPQVDALGPEVVRDSKLLTPRQREQAYALITRQAVAWGIGSVTPHEIDSLGITYANRLAMVRALQSLAIRPDYILIDALTLPEVDLPQEGIVHGDRLCLSIAAASVVAKETRDRWAREEDARYPCYGNARHKGYPTPEHLRRLAILGPSPIHRRSFGPVRELLEREAGALRYLREGPSPATPASTPAVGSPRARVGARGEDLAAIYLEGQGYAIVQRNYRCPEGEMDIVAREGDVLVFVEVRTRRSGVAGTPEESVTAAKGRRLIAVAERFLQEHPNSPQEWRIDLIALRPSGGRDLQIEHLRHAVEGG